MRINNMLKTKVSSKILAGVITVLAVGAIAGASSAAVKAGGAVKDADTVDEITNEETSNGEASEDSVVEVIDVDGENTKSESVEEVSSFDIPLAATPSTDENQINHGYEYFIIPEDAVPSDENMLFSKSFDYKDYPVLVNAVESYQNQGFIVSEDDTEYLDQQGAVQTGKEIYTVYLYDIVQNDHIYSGSIAFRSPELCKQYFDESEFDGEKYVQEKELDDGFKIYRCYDTATYLMYDFVYMDGNYATDSE